MRDALILSESGAVVASYAAAGQALLLLAFVPAYGAFASRVNRVRLVCGVTLFFAVESGHLRPARHRPASASASRSYLWLGIFNLVVVAQFWAFANDLYTNERGERLFPIVGVGAIARRLGRRRRSRRWSSAGSVRTRSCSLAAGGLAGRRSA